jgi:dTDP-4-dehydrorhamnose reductase
VDKAEKQRGNLQGSAWIINVDGTKNIINACKKTGKKLINISTDFVFDGKAGPYGEDDQVVKSEDQICWYGWTKLQAEKQILEANIPYLILRISYPYRSTFEPKVDFVRNIINRLENDNLYPMFDDQYLTPTFIDDLASAIKILIENEVTGIYHVAIPEVVTPYQVALKAAEIFGYDKKRVKKSSLVQFQNENKNFAIRPQHGGLKTDKINKFLSFSNLENSLLIMKEQMGR